MSSSCVPASQCLYYLLNGAVLEGFNLIFGTSVSLTQIFTTKGLETESAEGLLNITAVLCSFVAGYDMKGHDSGAHNRGLVRS